MQESYLLLQKKFIEVLGRLFCLKDNSLTSHPLKEWEREYLQSAFPLN